MMNDLDIKNKRILLFDFDGTLIETASGNTFATDLTDMRIKMDVVNKALDLMQENGVKVFAIVSNQGGVEAGFVSGADIEAKIEYVLRSVHDLAVKRGIRGVLYEKRLCYSNDEQNPMRKPNTGMTDQFAGYNILDKENDCNFVRLKVDHTVAFSLGDGIHTNGIESFWAILKRGVYGVFHNVSVKYMQKYVNEFCYRLNHRDNNEAFASLVELAVI